MRVLLASSPNILTAERTDEIDVPDPLIELSIPDHAFLIAPIPSHIHHYRTGEAIAMFVPESRCPRCPKRRQ